MGSLVRIVAEASFLLAALTAGHADAVQARHARVELLSQRLGPSGQLWLAIHFSLEKDWHIYWINPGDSGLPPTLQWQLPPGFSAGEIQWPRPEKLKRSTLADYGYQDDAVLLVPLHAPNGLKSGDKVEIGLQVKWLICREVCIADHADLHLSLPPSTAAQDPSQPVFTEARKRLPAPWPHSWKTWAVSEKDDFVLSVTTGKPLQSAEFFPLLPDQVENASPQPLQTTARGAKITLKKSDQLLKPIQVLKGLLVLGSGESYQIQAPVTATQKQAQ